mgnify:CR=1 FL=1
MAPELWHFLVVGHQVQKGFFFSCSVLEAVYPRKGIMPETLLLGFSPSQFYGVDLKSSKAPCA